VALYDVAVIGLGGMGSAVLAHCARRGMRSIGYEQFTPGHDLGASSGQSRMIRKAYYEHPSYVPLLLRAYDAWRELERASNTELLHVTGLLMIGGEDSAVLRGAMQSASEYALPVEYLNASQGRGRFPMFCIRDNEYAVYEADGGYVVPEAAIQAHLGLALDAGAQMNYGRAVDLDRVLEKASHVVVCAGPWLESMGLGIPLEIERNVQHWFAPSGRQFSEGQCPAFLIEREGFAHPLYGFPNHGQGVKAAFHGSGQTTHANALDREVHDTDIEPVRSALDSVLPGAAIDYVGGKACMYALTPDRHFVISSHPREPRIMVAGGFSGHGFKFVPVVGEMVADLIAGERIPFDIDFFSATRF
jgi:sarcosine oxidase